MDPRISIAQKLIGQVATASDTDPATLSAQTRLNDIGLDSILLAIVLRSVEVEFAIEFDDNEIAAFFGAASIGDYVDIVCRALSAKDPS